SGDDDARARLSRRRATRRGARRRRRLSYNGQRRNGQRRVNTPPFMKILVAIDGSPQSQAALERLVEKLAFFRDTPQLVLLHVHAPVPYKAAASWVGRDAIDKYYSDESDEAL